MKIINIKKLLELRLKNFTNIHSRFIMKSHCLDFNFEVITERILNVIVYYAMTVTPLALSIFIIKLLQKNR